MAEFFTDRFHLRSFKDDDIELVFRGLSNPNVIEYYGISFMTMTETKKQMEWYAQLERDETGQWFAITSLEGDRFYGAAGFSSWNKEHQKAEIGIWVMPEFWKRGIMREVFPALCKYGFAHLNLFRIEAFIEAENDACLKAIQKVHFTHEGTLRKCENKRGRFIDLHIYSRLVIDEVPPRPF